MRDEIKQRSEASAEVVEFIGLVYVGYIYIYGNPVMAIWTARISSRAKEKPEVCQWRIEDPFTRI